MPVVLLLLAARGRDLAPAGVSGAVSACGAEVHGLLGSMEELHLITDKGAEPSTVKRLVGAFAGLRSSQVVRAAFGHLSLFGALVAYTALGGLVSKTLSIFCDEIYFHLLLHNGSGFLVDFI